MKLIIGLGNLGGKYERTRHNVGFMAIDELAQKLMPVRQTLWKADKKDLGETLRIPSREVVLAKPRTMMNASGYAVAKIFRHYDMKVFSDLWVVHDDLDLGLGKIKISQGKGAAGHHGIESIVEELGTDGFVRFRLGIGHPAKGESENLLHREVERYVLESFEGKQAVEAQKMIKKAVEIIVYGLKFGLAKTMSRFNAG